MELPLGPDRSLQYTPKSVVEVVALGKVLGWQMWSIYLCIILFSLWPVLFSLWGKENSTICFAPWHVDVRMGGCSLCMSPFLQTAIFCYCFDCSHRVVKCSNFKVSKGCESYT
jgi:hypothetical protein